MIQRPRNLNTNVSRTSCDCCQESKRADVSPQPHQLPQLRYSWQCGIPNAAQLLTPKFLFLILHDMHVLAQCLSPWLKKGRSHRLLGRQPINYWQKRHHGSLSRPEGTRAPKRHSRIVAIWTHSIETLTTAVEIMTLI